MCLRIGECGGYETSSIRTAIRRERNRLPPLRLKPLRAREAIGTDNRALEQGVEG